MENINALLPINVVTRPASLLPARVITQSLNQVTNHALTAPAIMQRAPAATVIAAPPMSPAPRLNVSFPPLPASARLPVTAVSYPLPPVRRSAPPPSDRPSSSVRAAPLPLPPPEALRAPGVNIAEKVLNNLDLRKLDLTAGDLGGATLYGCQFSGAHFVDLTLENSQLVDCNGDDASFKHANLRGATFNNTSLINAEFPHSDLTNSRLTNVDMRGADAVRTKFTNTHLHNCKLTGALLKHANFDGATLSGSLQGADLHKVSMQGVKIVGADFNAALLPSDFSLALPRRSDKRAVAQYFAQQPAAALMRAIHTIDNQQPKIKIALAKQLTAALTPGDLPPGTDTAVLFDILAKMPYRGSQRISAFITNHFSRPPSDATLPGLSPAQLDKAVQHLPPEQRSEHYIDWLRAQQPRRNLLMQRKFKYERTQVLECLLKLPREGQRLDLRGLDLRGVRLHQLALQNIDLDWADLRDTTFVNCAIKATTLRSALMQNCQIQFCTFHADVNLQAVDLYNAAIFHSNMSGIVAHNTNFRRTRFNQVQLSHARFAHSDLSHTGLINCTMTGAELAFCDLQSTYIAYSNLNQVCMPQSQLDNADLIEVELDNTDLTTTTLGNINFARCDLENARLSNSLSFQLPQSWDGTSLDLHLNHFHNASGSLLTTLNSIQPQHAQLKLRLARQLIGSLSTSGVDLSAVRGPLIDVLGQPFWRADEQINSFISPVIRHYLASYHDQPLPTLRVSLLQATLGEFAREPGLALAHDQNHTFIQLIDQTIYGNHGNHGNQILKHKAILRYQYYLQLPAVQQMFSLPAFVEAFGDNQGRADWSRESGSEAQNYVLLPARAEGPTMLLSGENLQSMLAPDEHTSWSHYYLFRNGRVLEHASYQPRSLFAGDFPLFMRAYLEQQHNAKFWKFLGSLKLGAELHQLFLDARQQPASSRKLIGLEDGLKLAKVFSPLMQLTGPVNSRQYNLTRAHYQAIVEHYQLNDASDSKKAATFLSLATVFARYSSSTVFGGEETSPEWIRYWAYAAMAEAYRLDPSLFLGPDRQMMENKFVDLFPLWRGRLLGEEDHFSCTNVLADNMLPQLRDKCPQTLNSIYPSTWG